MKKTALLAAALMFSAPASSAVTVYRFNGTIEDIRDFGTGVVTSNFRQGEKFAGTIAYDPDAPFGYLMEPSRALFHGPGAPFSANVGGLMFSGPSRQVQLFDDYSGYDMVFISSHMYADAGLPPTLAADNTYQAVARFQLRSYDTSVINNMALPDVLSLDPYAAQRHFGLTGYDSSGAFTWHIAGTIQTLAPVPEPTTWAMMLIGFAAVGGAMRSAKRRKKVAVSFA